MAKSDSALVTAAAVFAEELAVYARVGELFIKNPLGSVKHLERANQLLGEIATCEVRLQTAGQELVKALSAARSQQEALATSVVAHVPIVQQRNDRLRELMAELSAVATEVSGLNTQIAGKSTNGDASEPYLPTMSDALDVSATTLALSERAAALATTAQDAELEELASQAHSLHQRLQAIGKQLAKVGAAS